MRAEYRRPTDCGQVERAELERSTLSLPLDLEEMIYFFSLPAGSKDGLHILRLLIDGLIPAEAGLLRESCHRLDKLVDLGIQSDRQFKH